MGDQALASRKFRRRCVQGDARSRGWYCRPGWRYGSRGRRPLCVADEKVRPLEASAEPRRKNFADSPRRFSSTGRLSSRKRCGTVAPDGEPGAHLSSDCSPARVRRSPTLLELVTNWFRRASTATPATENAAPTVAPATSPAWKNFLLSEFTLQSQPSCNGNARHFEPPDTIGRGVD